MAAFAARARRPWNFRLRRCSRLGLSDYLAIARSAFSPRNEACDKHTLDIFGNSFQHAVNVAVPQPSNSLGRASTGHAEPYILPAAMPFRTRTCRALICLVLFPTSSFFWSLISFAVSDHWHQFKYFLSH